MWFSTGRSQLNNIPNRDRQGVAHQKVMKTPAWRRLSVCCAETRLGVGGIDTRVECVRHEDVFNGATTTARDTHPFRCPPDTETSLGAAD
jgi:hypothetical protein